MKNGCSYLLSLLPPVKSGLLAVIVGAVLPSAFAQEKSDDELVKELANPISSLISAPFQNNTEPTEKYMKIRFYFFVYFVCFC